jgi:uncharacterized OB-fold protein
MLPPLTDVNRPYWTGGAQGQLLIERCRRCRRWQHPPAGACRCCGADAAPEPVSGRGTVFTFTVNRHRYHPDVPPPYVIAIVELDEQPGLRLPTNIVGCEPEEVRIGARVEVRFEQHGEVHVPVFALADREAAA